jgi:gamma-aminobutyric acid receptor subunit beta
MRRIVVVIFVAVSIQLARGAETPALIERPASGNGPTQVSVGIWIVDISNIDSAQQTFTGDIAIVLRWKDARLAHTGTGVAHYGHDQIWTPRTGIANETSSVVHKLPESAEVEPDGTVLYRQRYVGSFTQPLRLRSFPFDRQTFHVQLVAVRYRPNEVRFVPDEDWVRNSLKDGAGIAPSITLPDWTIEKWETKPLTYALAPGL